MISKMPRISVLIANYNGKEHLELCIPSLRNQTYPADRVEIIIVDNGSIDDSIVFLQRNYPDVRIVCNEKNEGFAKANNQGAAIASGEYLALINNDMVAKPDWLEQLIVTQVRSGAECIAGVILNWDGTRIDFVDAGMTPFGFSSQLHFDEPVKNLPQYAQEKELFFACGGSMLIHRETFLTIGGFDEDFFCYYEDADLGFRLWVTGYRVVLSPAAYTFHRHHGTSQAFPQDRRKILLMRNRLFMVYKNYDNIRYLKCLIGLMLQMFIDICINLQAYLTTAKANEEAYSNMYIRTEALLEFVRQLPVMRTKRQKIQAERRCSDKVPAQLMDNPDSEIDKLLEKTRFFFQEFYKSFSN